MDTKKPWQSKTILLNGIVGMAGFIAMFIPQASGIQDFINHNAMAIGSVWSVLNVVIRFISKDKVSLTD